MRAPSSERYAAQKRARRFAFAAGAAAALLAGLGFAACGGAEAPGPAAVFAGSIEAGVTLAHIRDAWLANRAGTVSDPELRAKLERFLADYPTDDAAKVVRIYLALLYMRNAVDYERARAELEALKAVPAGTTQDLLDIAQARWLRIQGEVDRAYLMLLPKRGKSVDPIVRALLQEELVAITLDPKMNNPFEAISYMDTWLRLAAEDEREVTRAHVVAKIKGLDKDTLMTALANMRSGRAERGYSAEMLEIIGRRLAREALAQKDGELARLLLDPDAGTVVSLEGDAGLALEELAMSRAGRVLVEGRKIGLLLPTEAPELRDEAAAVLRGVMWGLGLPRGGRKLARAPVDAGTAAAPAVALPAPLCPDGAPKDPLVRESEEPTEKDDIALVVRDDDGDFAKVDESLAELAGEGAAVIIVGLEPKSARRAREWSKKTSVPVIVLVAPAPRRGEERARPASEYPTAFLLGEERERELWALTRAVPELAQVPVTPVLDESESVAVPDLAPSFPHVTLAPKVSCDVAPKQAGLPRFPLADWTRDRRRASIVTGAPSCAEDSGLRALLAELLRHRGVRPRRDARGTAARARPRSPRDHALVRGDARFPQGAERPRAPALPAGLWRSARMVDVARPGRGHARAERRPARGLARRRNLRRPARRRPPPGRPRAPRRRRGAAVDDGGRGFRGRPDACANAVHPRAPALIGFAHGAHSVPRLQAPHAHDRIPLPVLRRGSFAGARRRAGRRPRARRVREPRRDGALWWTATRGFFASRGAVERPSGLRFELAGRLGECPARGQLGPR